jgi:V/A-type H+-transporting ATPase subunit I
VIATMKRVTLLTQESAKDRSLEALRQLGVLHLAHVRPPESEELEAARLRLAQLRRALEAIRRRRDAVPSGREPDEVVEHLLELVQRRKELQEQLKTTVAECQRMAPFGSFDPDAVRYLSERGIAVRLYAAGAGQRLTAPPDVVVHELRRSRSGVWLAAIGRGEFEVEAAGQRLAEQSLPQPPPGAHARRRRELALALAETEDEIAAESGHFDDLSGLALAAEEHIAFLEARAGMGESAPVAWLQGFCPADHLDELRAAAPRAGWALLVEEPGEDEVAPTLIRNPRWVRPIQAVFDAIGILPGYREIDISSAFLVFLSLFFAMLVGDAGYGAVFLALTWWLRRRFPKAPAEPFRLLAIMSICTIVWGVVTGTYFGMARLPATLSALRLEWLAEPRNVMWLCFLLGAIHLTIAHAWSALRSAPSLTAVAQLGWIGATWTMFFAACTMVLGEAFPSAMAVVFAVSAALIILFMTPRRSLRAEWFQHAMLPLSLVSSFVDVVSYIRLFAVGTASLAVAAAFNRMALEGGAGGVLGGLGAALILFLGHGLNLLLCAMGVLVHGVRLNTLEFSSHLGLQWTGIPYRPFARQTARGDDHDQPKE